MMATARRGFTQGLTFGWVRQHRPARCVSTMARKAQALIQMTPATGARQYSWGELQGARNVAYGQRSANFNTKTPASKLDGEYHDLRSKDTFERKEWVGQSEELDNDRLDIDGHPVMQRWETPYMGELAKVATSNGGRVLEVGFGMAISATAVQSHKPKEHIIMEANGDVFKRLQQFQKENPSVTPMGPALWQDSIAKVEDNSLDGVLYDTYPLNKEEQHIHQFEFLGQVRNKLRPGGILTYCNLTSLGVLKNQYKTWEELFEKTQLPHLLEAGFKRDEIKKAYAYPVTPTSDCEYYSHDTAMVPVIIKGDN